MKMLRTAALLAAGLLGSAIPELVEGPALAQQGAPVDANAQPAPVNTAKPAAPADVVGLRDAALNDDIALGIVRDLTTEIGPRLAGTDAERRAREWSMARLTSMGFANVRVEEFDMPVWVRGAESAEIVGESPQKLAVAALGRSGATPRGGVTAEVVGFASVDELRAAPAKSLRGKIAYVSHRMTRTQDGSSYGYWGAVRRTAPALAAEKGAVATVIRSLGTDLTRGPHTGVTTTPEGRRPSPAGALSNVDADQLERLLAKGPVRMKLVLTPRFTGRQRSGNVIAEVPGTDPAAGVVLVGGHLDSWDLGTGAVDDAAGVAITAAAAKRVMDAGRPRRTIRVVWFGAEEVGIEGSAAYLGRNGTTGLVFASESDFGADRVWRADFNFAPSNAPLADRVMAALAPLGIARGADPASGGPDVGNLVRAGVSAIDLQQDGTRYFDLHHTPDDTFDKVDPAQLRQNVAAWTAMLHVVANAPEEIPQRPAAPAR